MERCRTCKWWLNGKGESGPQFKNANYCCNPKNGFAQRGFDDTINLDDDGTAGEVAPLDRGNVLDGSGYLGSLVPGPDFGCIHHEPAQPDAVDYRGKGNV